MNKHTQSMAQRGIVVAFAGVVAVLIGVTLANFPSVPTAADLLVTVPATVPTQPSESLLQPANLAVLNDPATEEVSLPDETTDPNEVVAVVTLEDGTEVSMTQADLDNAWSGSETPVDGDEPAGGTVSSDGTSFISTLTCENKVKTVKTTATGKTQLKEFRMTDPSTKKIIKQKLEKRCDRAEAESSAIADAEEAFKNACSQPDRCDNPDQCLSAGMVRTYKPNPLKFVTTVAEKQPSPEIMACPGGKAYTATAKVTGECTMTRRCQARNNQLQYQY